MARRGWSLRLDPKTGGTVYGPKPPTFRELEARWADMKAAFVQDVWTLMMRDPFVRLTVHVRPSRVGIWGDLLASRESDDEVVAWTGLRAERPSLDGTELVTAERIPPSDRAGIARWLERFAGKLPVFPVDQ